MYQNLPSTPAEVLNISTKKLEEKIFQEVEQALISGEWRYPYENAATSLEEMTITDMAYWIYKCTNPIIHFESDFSEQLNRDEGIISLPNGFQKEKSITFGAIGDLLQAPGLEFSKDILFEDISDLLFDQTVSFANFESPVTTQELKKEIIGDKEAPIECCNNYQFQTLSSHQGKYFTVMNFSNNHTLDMGIEGIETTNQAFRESNILGIGVNEDSTEYGKGKFLETNGIKIGFVSTAFGLNGHILSDEDFYRIHVSKILSKSSEADLSLIKSQIDDCKKRKCDFIVASLHWGFEFEFFPRRRQIEIARSLVEYGADAIICHHPHVIQPVEYYRTKRDVNRIAPIAYSLGSSTWGFSAPHLVLSLIQNLIITKGHFQGKNFTYVEKSTVTPIFRSIVHSRGKIVTRLEKLKNHLHGNMSPHPKDYINAIKYYSDLVLNNTQDNGMFSLAA